MKIILSRKGFDNDNGKCASPIFPDGTMRSIPIPDEEDHDCYSDLSYNGIDYSKLLSSLKPTMHYEKCHVDPDIYPDIRNKAVDGWSPAFGQMNSPQGYLRNSGIAPGDIFLFFGWFRRVEMINEQYMYVKKDNPDLHIVFGYFQIGKIIKDKSEIAKYYWHPHAHYLNDTNTLYIPTESLSLNTNMKGFGTLNYRDDRVLTLPGKSRGIWKEYDFLKPNRIIGQGRKNSAKDGGLYYAGVWQELVFEANEEMLDWVKTILTD